MPEPRWPKTTSDYLKDLAEEFRKNLARISRACAMHESAEIVLQRHADEAFDTLSRIGLNRRPFYQRSEFFVGLGVGAWGLAAQIPDFCSGLFPDAPHVKDYIVCGVMIGLVIVGLGLIIIGWLRGGGKV